MLFVDVMINNTADLVGLESPYSQSAHQDCVQRYEALRDDLHRYKAKMQAALSKYEISVSFPADCDIFYSEFG